MSEKKKRPCETCPRAESCGTTSCTEWIDWFTAAWYSACKGVKLRVEWEKQKGKRQHFGYDSPTVTRARRAAAADLDVIRCAECVHWQHEDDVDFVCAVHGGYRLSTDYCSYGERRQK